MMATGEKKAKRTCTSPVSSESCCMVPLGVHRKQLRATYSRQYLLEPSAEDEHEHGDEELQHRRSHLQVGESLAAQLRRLDTTSVARYHRGDTRIGVQDAMADATNQCRPVPRPMQLCLG